MNEFDLEDEWDAGSQRSAMDDMDMDMDIEINNHDTCNASDNTGGLCRKDEWNQMRESMASFFGSGEGLELGTNSNGEVNKLEELRRLYGSVGSEIGSSINDSGGANSRKSERSKSIAFMTRKISG